MTSDPGGYLTVWEPVLATTEDRGTDLAGIRLQDVRRPAAAAVALADSDEPLLLVGHSSASTRMRVVATYVAANQPGRLVGQVSTDHAPAATAVALEKAIDVAADAGHAASAWADILDQTWSAAVLSSVTRLSRPNPTMSQHLRSWWPGSRFVVRQGDDPRSVPAARAEELVADLPRRALEAYVTAGADDELVRRLVAQVAPTQVRTVEGMAGWPGVFGITEQLQLVLVSADATRLVRPPGPPCDGCGQHASDPVCVFCRTTTGRRPDLLQPAGVPS